MSRLRDVSNEQGKLGLGARLDHARGVHVGLLADCVGKR